MRVIAGSAKRLQLKTIPGLETRPTTDRIKETLFNMLQPEILDCRFLDLFSGSGAIGIEALSRGAAETVFVEQNPAAVLCIKENLKTTRLEKGAAVIQGDVIRALNTLILEGKTFDLIFMDPPYRMGWEKKILEYIKDSSLADETSLIIVEASLDTDFSWLSENGYQLVKNKEYKTNKHVFICKNSAKQMEDLPTA